MVRISLIAGFSIVFVSAFAGDDLPSVSGAGAPEKVDTKCITVAHEFGRAVLRGDIEDVHLSPDMFGRRIAEFMVGIHQEQDPEKLWAETRPLGLHYLTSTIPVPELTREQVVRMKKAIDDMIRKQKGPAYMVPRIVIKIIETEGKLLKDDAERLDALKDRLRRLERDGKKLEEQEVLKNQIEELEKKLVVFEESILAKYAEFIDSARLMSVDFFPDVPEDLNALSQTAYDAALRRAKRLGIRYREVRLESGPKAIEYLPGPESEIGKLAATVQRMTKNTPTPFRAVFSPTAVIRARHLSGNTYLDTYGDLSVPPQFILRGEKDYLNTPMLLRALQMQLMQTKGTPTPFRGAVTQDVSTVKDPSWIGLDQILLQGPFFRGFPKAFQGQDPELKKEMAAKLHDAINDGRQILYLTGAGLMRRFAGRAIDKLNMEKPKDDVDLSAYGGGGFLKVDIGDGSGEKLTGQIVINLTEGGMPLLLMHSRHGRFRAPLLGKDFKAAMTELAPLAHQKLDGTNVRQFQMTPAQREAMVQLLRVVQRSIDVAENLTNDLNPQLDEVKDAAGAYVKDPSDANEAKLLAAAQAYKEPELDRLSLRGVGKEEPKTPAEATPPGMPGPKTPDRMLRALKAGQGQGKTTASYRKAVEDISVNAVRTVLERFDVDTVDRGPDLKGYDLVVTPRKPSSFRELFVEVKGTSDPLGSLNFTPAEIQFARNHLEKGDWVLAIAVLDKEGKTTLHFRRGIDLGPPLPEGAKGRPLLIHDLMTMGVEVAAEHVVGTPAALLPPPQ